jgi:hypothetical protein
MAEEDDDLAYWLAREYANARKEIVGTMTTMKRGPKGSTWKPVSCISYGGTMLRLITSLTIC